jgi:hypothetical protein
MFKTEIEPSKTLTTKPAGPNFWPRKQLHSLAFYHDGLFLSKYNQGLGMLRESKTFTQHPQ